MFPGIRITEHLYIESYTVLVSLAVVVLLAFFVRAFEKEQQFGREKTNKLLIILAISLGVTYLSAKLFDYLFHLIENPNATFEGITFLGGFIGGVLTFVALLYFKMKEERKNLLHIMNVAIPGVVLAHGVGRIGCLCAGCCYGIPTESPLGIVYPDVEFSYRSMIFDTYGEGVKVHPTQLYEALFLFAFYILLRRVKIWKEYTFAIYLIGYGVFRFLLEFIRGDDRGAYLAGVSPSQWLSILIVIAGSSILIFTKLKRIESMEKAV